MSVTQYSAQRGTYISPFLIRCMFVTMCFMPIIIKLLWRSGEAGGEGGSYHA